MADHLSSSIYSFSDNSIGDEGVMALVAAMKTATNLQIYNILKTGPLSGGAKTDDLH